MITFYEQARGFSHLASQKPCQDYGLSYEKDDIYLAIVCDGHGSDSYVRSDKGALFAAEIAKERILEFVRNQKTQIFLGKKGAITSKPLHNPLQGKHGERINFNELGESQQELVLQNKSYVVESTKYPEIEFLFRQLFANIVSDWRTRIQDDCNSNPFNKYEKEKLGSRRLEKAYGSTLMAAVRTKDYWFAFHIGDGKLLCCNNLMEWKEPVPWDCNCFLNTTTSLCDSNPIEEFRYAFDGTGYFPLAFALGSDGIDDTFVKQDLLYKFYSKMLCVFYEHPQEEARENLKKQLPILSEKGSHDDMSIAAIIDPTHLETATRYFSIISQRSSLNSERKEKEKSIDELKEKVDRLESEIEKHTCDYRSFCKSIWTAFVEFLEKKKNLQIEEKQKQKMIALKKEECARLKDKLNGLESDFEIWKAKGKEKISELREEAELLKIQIESESGQMINIMPDDSKNQTPLAEKMQGEEEKNEVVISSPLTAEESEQLDKESDDQMKEIMNNK